MAKDKAETFKGRYQLVSPLEDGYTVAEWCPDQHAQVPPTQVHLIVPIKNLGFTLSLRLKSRRALDELIATLKKHGDSVWPT